MKNKKLLLLLLIAICVCTLGFVLLKQQDKSKDYPSYETIVSAFFENYAIKRYTWYNQIKFEKRPTGWHVLHSDTETGAKSELLWSAKTKEFNPINLQKVKDKTENKEHLDYHLNSWEKEYFSNFPYYGYEDWSADVIEHFGNVDNLSDHTLFAVGSAYANYASSLLSVELKLEKSKLQLDVPEGKNSLTPEQLQKFRFYGNKAIEKFQKLTKQNPDYETRVGNIGLKTANECVYYFLILRVFQNEVEAKKELINCQYSDLEIKKAKAYLNSCAKQAILFTNADNDTFHLLYVQAKLGYRTDVLVVNVNLLSSQRYLNSLRDFVLSAKALPLSLGEEDLSGSKRLFIPIVPETNEEMDIKALVAFASDDKNLKEYRNGTGVQSFFNYAPTNKFSLKKGDRMMKWQHPSDVLQKDMFVLLDVLATNNWDRPIYFVDVFPKGNLPGLQKYLQLKGLVYTLDFNN